MLQIGRRQMTQMAQAGQLRQREEEPLQLAAQLRHEHPALMQQRSDATVQAELREALARCDELGLHEPEDRRIFCQWDQLLCPGMRHLPQWPQWLAHCRTRQRPGEHSLLLRLLLETPPAWWQRQLQQHEEARCARGLPSLGDAIAAAQAADAPRGRP